MLTGRITLIRLLFATDLLRGAFSPFGSILEIRVFKEKGYGFIRFGDKASACKAICEMHNKEVSGHPCKCAWGRESTGMMKGDPERNVKRRVYTWSVLITNRVLISNETTLLKFLHINSEIHVYIYIFGSAFSEPKV